MKTTRRTVEVSAYHVSVYDADSEKYQCYSFRGASEMHPSEIVEYTTTLLTMLEGAEKAKRCFVSPEYIEEKQGKYLATIDHTTLINNANLKEIEKYVEC